MIADFLLLISANIFAVALIVIYLVSALTSWNRLWRMSGSAVLAFATASHQLLVSYGSYQTDNIPIAIFYVTVFLTNLVLCLIPVAAILVCLSVVIAILNFINRYTTVYFNLYRIPVVGHIFLRFVRLQLQAARNRAARQEALERKLHPWLYIKDQNSSDNKGQTSQKSSAKQDAPASANASPAAHKGEDTELEGSISSALEVDDILKNATRILPKETGFGGIGTIFNKIVHPQSRVMVKSEHAHAHAPNQIQQQQQQQELHARQRLEAQLQTIPEHANTSSQESLESLSPTNSTAPTTDAALNASNSGAIIQSAHLQDEHNTDQNNAASDAVDASDSTSSLAGAERKLVPNTKVPYSSVQTLGTGALSAQRYTIDTPNNSYDEFKVQWDELLAKDASGKTVRKTPQIRSNEAAQAAVDAVNAQVTNSASKLQSLQAQMLAEQRALRAPGYMQNVPYDEQNMIFTAPDGTPYPRVLPQRQERDGTYTTADMTKGYEDSAFQTYLADELPRPTLTELFHLKKKPNEEATRTAISAACIAAQQNADEAGIANDGSRMKFTVGVLQESPSSQNSSVHSASAHQNDSQGHDHNGDQGTGSGIGGSGSSGSSSSSSSSSKPLPGSAPTDSELDNSSHAAATYTAPGRESISPSAAPNDKERHIAWRQGLSILSDELIPDTSKTHWGSLDLSTVPTSVLPLSERSKYAPNQIADKKAKVRSEIPDATEQGYVAPEMRRISRWAHHHAQVIKNDEPQRLLHQEAAHAQATREHHAQAQRERSSVALHAVATAAKNAALGNRRAWGYHLSPAVAAATAEQSPAASNYLRSGNFDYMVGTGNSIWHQEQVKEPRAHRPATFNANATTQDGSASSNSQNVLPESEGEDEVQVYTAQNIHQLEDPSLKQYQSYLYNQLIEWIKAFCRYCGYFMCFLSLIFAAYNTLQIMTIPETNNVTVNLNVPMSFDGLRIVQISDLNVSPLFNRKRVSDLVLKIMQLRPDLIVFTGNISMGEPWIRETDLKPLFMLNAPLGVYAVPGDRDYSMHFMHYLNLYESNNFELLLNESRSILYMGAKMNIIGIADESAPLYGIFLPSFEQITVDPDSCLNIILTHNSRNARNYQTSGYHSSDLILSGNTLTSQISFLDEITSHINNGFLRGLYQLSPIGMLYVSGGTGVDPMLPIRYGNHSELTLITVHSTRALHPSPESNVQPQLEVPARTITVNMQNGQLLTQQQPEQFPVDAKL